MKIDQFGNKHITVQFLEFEIKTHYYPALLWIKRFRPKKRDYEIIAQLGVDKELYKGLKELLEAIKEELEK